MTFSALSYRSQLSALSARSTLAVPARVAVAVAYTLMTWDEAYRSRKALKRLTPDQLKDIGITAQDVRAEIRKPFFW